MALLARNGGKLSCEAECHSSTASITKPIPCALAPTRNNAPVGPSRRQVPLLPCRVTNTSEEIYKSVDKPLPSGEEDKFLYIDQMQVHNPELGRLERRVSKFYLEELFNDTGVDLEETAYWFHTPPGGWNSEPLKMKTAEEAPTTFPQPQHLDAEQQGRVMIEELQEGQVFTAPITDCWLLHGIQVDIGADFDGLVPLTQDEWMEEGVRQVLCPGEMVTIRVHKVRQPGLYRWPVQCELLEPSHISSKIMAPDLYEAPIDHAWCAELGWSVEDVCKATGRTYEPTTYFLGPNQADSMQEMQDAYGYDDPENNLLSDEVEEKIAETVELPRVEALMNDMMTSMF